LGGRTLIGPFAFLANNTGTGSDQQ